MSWRVEVRVGANWANVFCFPSSLPCHHGSFWDLPVITLLLTKTVSPVRPCLTIWWERFRGTQKMQTIVGLLVFNPLCILHGFIFTDKRSTPRVGSLCSQHNWSCVAEQRYCIYLTPRLAGKLHRWQDWDCLVSSPLAPWWVDGFGHPYLPIMLVLCLQDRRL